MIMDKVKRKELINAYKNKPIVGGVYSIVCSGNGRRWIRPSLDMASSKSRFEFAVKIQSCPEPSMQREWMEYGFESFSFECLEELKMGDTQTEWEFENDIRTLYDAWNEKYEQGEL